MSTEPPVADDHSFRATAADKLDDPSLLPDDDADGTDDDWEFNPTFVDRDGDPITVENPGPGRPYDRATIRVLYVEEGYSSQRIADELDANLMGLRRAIEDWGFELRWDWRQGPGEGCGEVSDLVEQAKADAPTLEDEPQATNRCPECDAVHDTAAAQQHCIRTHARDRADRGGWVA